MDNFALESARRGGIVEACLVRPLKAESAVLGEEPELAGLQHEFPDVGPGKAHFELPGALLGCDVEHVGKHGVEVGRRTVVHPGPDSEGHEGHVVQNDEDVLLRGGRALDVGKIRVDIEVRLRVEIEPHIARDIEGAATEQNRSQKQNPIHYNLLGFCSRVVNLAAL